MKSLLLILTAIIFLSGIGPNGEWGGVLFFERGVPVPDSIEVYFPRSHETVLMIWENGIYHEHHDVPAGPATLLKTGEIVRQLECEVE